MLNLKESKIYLGATVDPETIRKLDKIRGEIPRSRLVEKAIVQFLERNAATGERSIKE
jgi:predicted transcriptional regulator